MIATTQQRNAAAEYAELDRIIAAQPEDSYLRPILSGIRDSVRAAIRNDLTFIEFDSWKLDRDAAELGRRLESQRKQTAELAATIEEQRRQLARIVGDFETIGGDAATIGRTATQQAAALRAKLGK